LNVQSPRRLKKAEKSGRERKTKKDIGREGGREGGRKGGRERERERETERSLLPPTVLSLYAGT